MAMHRDIATELEQRKAEQAERRERIQKEFVLLVATFAMKHNLSGLELALVLAQQQHEHMAGIMEFQPYRDLSLNRTA